MAARVAEYPRPPIVSTNGAKRRTEADTFDMVTWIWDGCRRDEHTGKRAQQPQFIRESARVEVVLDRFSPHLTFIGSASVDMGEYATHDLHIVSD
jgi:hypothetical protein